VIVAIVESGHPDNQTSRAVPFASQIVSRYLRNEGVPPDRQVETIPHVSLERTHPANGGVGQ